MLKKEEKKLKTFNLDEKLYREFSEYCKENGISMSKRIENFIREELLRLKGEIKIIEERIVTKGKEIEHSFQKYC